MLELYCLLLGIPRPLPINKLVRLKNNNTKLFVPPRPGDLVWRPTSRGRDWHRQIFVYIILCWDARVVNQ